MPSKIRDEHEGLQLVCFQQFEYAARHAFQHAWIGRQASAVFVSLDVLIQNERDEACCFALSGSYPQIIRKTFENLSGANGEYQICGGTPFFFENALLRAPLFVFRLLLVTVINSLLHLLLKSHGGFTCGGDLCFSLGVHEKTRQLKQTLRQREQDALVVQLCWTPCSAQGG